MCVVATNFYERPAINRVFFFFNYAFWMIDSISMYYGILSVGRSFGFIVFPANHYFRNINKDNGLKGLKLSSF